MRTFIALDAVIAFLLALVLTARFRQFALRRGMLDVPNARSSHRTPTPRGGGVAIVMAVVAILPVLALQHVVSWSTAGALALAGVLAAAVGYADDRASLSIRVRLVVQFVAAGVVLALCGTTAVTNAIPPIAAVPVLGAILAILYLVWMLNLTNFMDGIDGLASIEVITVCLGLLLCTALLPQASLSETTLLLPATTALQVESIAVMATVAAATLGFVYWNWPPARIFMGDAGSGFLGLLLGTLTMLAGALAPALAWASLIVGGAFVVDATTTLVTRLIRREKVHQAHRSHAYQHAARRWGHQRVTIAVTGINLLWLLPCALMAVFGMLHGAVALIIAYIPLLALAVRLRAGFPDPAPRE